MDQPETLTLMMALCGGVKDSGDEARFVGGCVRDAILNRAVYDIDIATIWSPDEVISRLKAAKIKAIPTGIDHGTVTAVVNGHPFEITTLRSDIETDGRHAKVEFTKEWREDARRRDFTMNAMYASVRGEVFDFFNGLEDAKAGVVRFIDDAATRIAEDYLRILRFYRFNAHYASGDPSSIDREACAKNVQYLTGISAERVQVEFFKLLMSDKCDRILKVMKEDGVFNHILKSAKNIEAISRLVTLETDLESRTFIPRRLACLIGTDSSVAEKTADELRLSNADRTSLIFLCNPDNLVSPHADDHSLRKAVYKHDHDQIRSAMLLYAAYHEISSDDVRPAYDFVTKMRLPQFPIQGNDLIKRDVKPGKTFGDILKDLEAWWIEEDFQPGRTLCLEKLDEMLNTLK